MGNQSREGEVGLGWGRGQEGRRPGDREKGGLEVMGIWDRGRDKEREGQCLWGLRDRGGESEGPNLGPCHLFGLC